jgi:hypothetical protein
MAAAWTKAHDKKKGPAMNRAFSLGYMGNVVTAIA